MINARAVVAWLETSDGRAPIHHRGLTDFEIHRGGKFCATFKFVLTNMHGVATVRLTAETFAWSGLLSKANCAVNYLVLGTPVFRVCYLKRQESRGYCVVVLYEGPSRRTARK